MILLLAPCAIVQKAEGNWAIQGAIEPTLYAAPRGSEGTQQVMGLLQIQRNRPENGFFFAAHLQAETLGSQNLNGDLNRIGYHSKESWGEVTVGRIHPWETGVQSVDPSGLPLWNPSYRAWSLHGQTQAQNLGLELGFPNLNAPPESAFRNPILAGWLGAHVWIPEGPSIPIDFSASASPFFLPTIGSQVRFSESQATQIGRFGRSPPNTVQVGDALLPLYYRINSENLIQEVVLQPQFMIQARVRSQNSAEEGWLEKAQWDSHFWISRAPQPDPVADAEGTIRVSESEIAAVAEVTPAFPQRWTFGLSERVRIPTWNVDLHLDMNAALSSSGKNLPPGAQIGLQAQALGLNWYFSYLYRANPSGSTSMGTPTESLFENSLFQAEIRKTFSERWHFSFGSQAHLHENSSLWLASALTYTPIASALRLQLTGDVFAGGIGSYFGEWRANDRVALVASYNWE